MWIDLSCDLGEAHDPASEQVESDIWPLITSANVACGGHTGDRTSMQRAVEHARQRNVSLGAHPSYPDRQNFGRTSLSISPSALVASLIEQLSLLGAIAEEGGIRISHVKPHGALYNDSHHDAAISSSIVEAVRQFDPAVAVVCSTRSVLFKACSAAGLRTVAEGFGDRKYREDGSLTPRSRPDALLLDRELAASQALSLARGEPVVTSEGGTVSVTAQTICIHSDMEGAVERLRAIRGVLSAEGFQFSSCHKPDRSVSGQ